MLDLLLLLILRIRSMLLESLILGKSFLPFCKQIQATITGQDL